MAEDQDGTVEQAENGGAKARRILTDIAPHSWEHPADKAALQAKGRVFAEASAHSRIRRHPS